MPIENEIAGERTRVSDLIVIYPRGKRGTWTAEYWYENQHHRKTLHTRNKKIAEQRARDLDQRLVKGEVLHRQERLTLDEAIKEFIDAKKNGNRARKTIIKYEGELKKFAEFAKSRRVAWVHQITPSLLDAYEKERKEHDELEAYTLYNHLIILKTLCNWLKHRGRITSNPIAELKLEEPVRTRYPAATPEQVTTILNAAAGVIFALLALLAFTGLRVGEAVALRPEDVDLGGGLVHVRGRKGWGPKTAASQRSVPVHPRLKAILVAYAAAAKKARPLFFMIAKEVSPEGRALDARRINTRFQDLATQHGISVGRDNGGLTLHALRRFFKTSAYDAGVPKPMVDAWLGHRDQDDMDYFYYDSRKGHEWMEKLPFGEATATDLERLKA